MYIKASYLQTSKQNPLYQPLPPIHQIQSMNRPKDMNIITNLLSLNQDKSQIDYLNFSFKDMKDQFSHNKIYQDNIYMSEIIRKAYRVHKKFNVYSREFNKLALSQLQEKKIGRFSQVYDQLKSGKSAFTIAIEEIEQKQKNELNDNSQLIKHIKYQNQRSKNLGYYSKQLQSILTHQPNNLDQAQIRLQFMAKLKFS